MKAWRVGIRENPDMTSIVFADTSTEAKETLRLCAWNTGYATSDHEITAQRTPQFDSPTWPATSGVAYSPEEVALRRIEPVRESHFDPETSPKGDL